MNMLLNGVSPRAGFPALLAAALAFCAHTAVAQTPGATPRDVTPAGPAVTAPAGQPATAVPGPSPGAPGTDAGNPAPAAGTPPGSGAPVSSGAPPGAAAPDASSPADSPPGEAGGDTKGLDQEVQGLKKDVVDLNRDLFVLEEELLFPANTQVAVFLSMDVGDFFSLDSVQLKIDQKEVINYLYTPREVEALLKGGVHRLYLGNLKVGKHELVAFFSGKGPNDRDYKRGASLKFEKGIGAKYLELKINDRQRRLQPEFEIKDWE
jgi:hypothetical protein